MNNEFDIWTEKYRPKTVEDYVFKDATLKAQVEEWIKNPTGKRIPLPNILLAGTQGAGKTSLARMICNELGLDKHDILEINASRENNVDTIREKIVNYCSTWAIGDYKVVILDECLEENEMIRTSWNTVRALKDFEVDQVYDVLSFNMDTQKIEQDKAQIISEKNDKVYEVLYTNGKMIKATADHPFICLDNGISVQKQLKELVIGDSTLIMKSNGSIQEAVIEKITDLGVMKVRNLTVSKNHTFITESGIITHNCDGLTVQGQRILRAEIERYYDSVRFIGTANYIAKIIPALKSRFEVYTFDALDMESFLSRMMYVLDEEKIEYNSEDLIPFVEASYPDLRKAINLLSQYSIKNTLMPLEQTESNKDYLLEMANLIKQKKFKEARKLVCSQVRTDEIEDVYKFFYQNLDLFSTNSDKQGQAILDIAQGLKEHATSSNPEITLAATFVRLSRI